MHTGVVDAIWDLRSGISGWMIATCGGTAEIGEDFILHAASPENDGSSGILKRQGD
jgi:hypothetical protein